MDDARCPDPTQSRQLSECLMSEIQKAAPFPGLFNPHVVVYSYATGHCNLRVLGIISLMYTSNHYSIDLLDITRHGIDQGDSHPSPRQDMNPQPLGIAQAVVGALDLGKHALRLRLRAP